MIDVELARPKENDDGTIEADDSQTIAGIRTPGVAPRERVST